MSKTDRQHAITKIAAIREEMDIIKSLPAQTIGEQEMIMKELNEELITWLAAYLRAIREENG